MTRRAWCYVPRWSLLLGACALGCSVDQRDLELAAGGNIGAGGTSLGAPLSETSPDAGDTGRVGDAGAAGTYATPEPEPTAAGGSAASPSLPPLLDGCADLDTDGTADCKVTLVQNPSFKIDVNNWAAVGAATLSWDSRNALADTPSGCGLLTATGSNALAGSAPFRAAQCVPIAPNQTVIAYANAIVDAPNGASDAAQAELEVTFFGAADCKGAPTGQFFTPPSAAGTWTTIQAGGVSGPAAASASVALVVFKPNHADRLSACFDNVMVKTKPQ